MTKKWSIAILVLVLSIMLIVTGCGNNNAAEETNQETQQPSNQPQTPAENPPAGQEWKVEWDKLVAAAKQEGKLAISGPPGELWREAVLLFEKEYPEIKIEYLGTNSRDFWPKVEQERKLGQKLWDMRIGGPDPDTFKLKNSGDLIAVKPLLILPEVIDESKWSGGYDGLFADKENMYMPSFTAYARETTHINRDVIPESEMNSDAQLLDPKYKGKIVLQDPRGGAGLGMLAILLGAYGEEFVTKLLTEQEVVVTSDGRQMAEWLVRGNYPIALGINTDQIHYFEQQGLKANIGRLDDGAIGMTIGFGGVQMIEGAPNPNAAQVFVNWLLTQKTQQSVVDIVATNSVRNDVKQYNEEEVVKEELLDTYYNHQDESFAEIRIKAAQMAAQLIK